MYQLREEENQKYVYDKSEIYISCVCVNHKHAEICMDRCWGGSLIWYVFFVWEREGILYLIKTPCLTCVHIIQELFPVHSQQLPREETGGAAVDGLPHGDDHVRGPPHALSLQRRRFLRRPHRLLQLLLMKLVSLIKAASEYNFAELIN